MSESLLGATKSPAWIILLTTLGLTSSQIVTAPAPAICSPQCQNGGTCVASVCSCLAGWTGFTCDQPVCSQSCGNNGRCTSPNVCSCEPDWTGPTCSISVCSPDCENDGICMAPNSCVCNSDYWGGLRCNKSLCFCVNGGTCTYPNTSCSCPRGWNGRHCKDDSEQRIGVNLNVLLLSLALTLSSVSAILLSISLILSKMKKRKPSTEDLPDLEIHENAAYHSSIRRKSPKPKIKKKKVQYKPMNDSDAIYENPVSTLSISEKESIYENTSYNIYDN